MRWLFLTLFFVAFFLGSSRPLLAGPYLELGPTGLFPLSSDDLALDPGPGIGVTFGYDFRYVGLRATGFYSYLEFEAGREICDYGCAEGSPFVPPGVDLAYHTTGNESAHYAGGSLDLAIYPMTSALDQWVTPFIIIGGGGNVLANDVPQAGDYVGIFADLGGGLRFRITENLFAEFETLYRPTGFLAQGTGDNFGEHLLSVSGGVGFTF